MVMEHAKKAVRSVLRPTISQELDSKSMSGRYTNMFEKYVRINESLSQFKNSVVEEPMLEGQVNAGGFKVHQDEKSHRDLVVTSPAREIARLKADMNKASRWTALHFELGTMDFTKVDSIGVAIKSKSYLSATTTQVCLRSGNHRKFRDYFWPHHMVSTTVEGRHFDVHHLGKDPNVPRQADWHELVLFFRSDHAIDVSIIDLRLFAI